MTIARIGGKLKHTCYVIYCDRRGLNALTNKSNVIAVKGNEKSKSQG